MFGTNESSCLNLWRIQLYHSIDLLFLAALFFLESRFLKVNLFCGKFFLVLTERRIKKSIPLFRVLQLCVQ